jgi:hypothetical protein
LNLQPGHCHDEWTQIIAVPQRVQAGGSVVGVRAHRAAMSEADVTGRP